MTDTPARLVRLAQQLEDQHAPQHMTVLMREAAKEMEQNLGQVAKLSEELERVKREAERAQDAHGVRFLNYLEETARLTDEIKRLEAEVKVWVNHTKTAVWSDSEECKVLSSEVERLLKSRNRWAKKYNDLLAKRRAEDGYDVYAAAREEYRKKITEQAAEIDRLRAALEVCDRVLHFDLLGMITWGKDYNQAVKDAADAARIALGEKA